MKIHHHTHIIKTSAKKACKICKLSSSGDRNKLLVLTQTAGDPSSSPKDGKSPYWDTKNQTEKDWKITD